MSAKKKIAKLQKKLKQTRIRNMLTISDLRIELSDENYRANLAEFKVRRLTAELDMLKVKDAIKKLPHTTLVEHVLSKTEPNDTNGGTKIEDTISAIAEITTGTTPDGGSSASFEKTG